MAQVSRWAKARSRTELQRSAAAAHARSGRSAKALLSPFGAEADRRKRFIRSPRSSRLLHGARQRVENLAEAARPGGVGGDLVGGDRPAGQRQRDERLGQEARGHGG